MPKSASSLVKNPGTEDMLCPTYLSEYKKARSHLGQLKPLHTIQHLSSLLKIPFLFLTSWCAHVALTSPNPPPRPQEMEKYACNNANDAIPFVRLRAPAIIKVSRHSYSLGRLRSVLRRARCALRFDGMLTTLPGGLSTSIKSMKANLLLSTCVAITGIAAPMGLSFILGPMVGATLIQSFAAGAALCSTSLGTTFTVLGTSGLVSTRLGSVLTTAAMMDDVVGLVMVQIVSSLGSSGSQSPSSISPATVIRPVLVSAAFAVRVRQCGLFPGERLEQSVFRGVCVIVLALDLVQ